ncbi:MAG: hypothetical protein K6T81_16365 [Alicyclobacillus macrosporangiidus]|uniref:hypothetical protein n=1 Tax=Alicyclobacillus macrosporangiidus TaxID=392015 RepID=UPI0026EC4537|nr:hypothetical protein [Alicyclobacillus macrosporangiidus]MCL6600289.1 hypothetical protein [Alicyclobacillus macrosporangiidus]
MAERFAVPIVGAVPSLQYTVVDPVYNTPNLMVNSYAPYKRFAIPVIDEGLDSAGLMPGDYAIFREQRWPNDECQVCLVAFGDEVALRILEDIWNTEPVLRVCGDRIPPERRHRNDFIVLGVLDGVVKAGLEELEYPESADFDWGC